MSSRSSQPGPALLLTATRVGIVGIAVLVWTSVIVRSLDATAAGAVLVTAAWPSLISGMVTLGMPAVLVNRLARTTRDEVTLLSHARRLAQGNLLGGSAIATAGLLLASPTLAGVGLALMAGTTAIAASVAQSRLRFGRYGLMTAAPHALACGGTVVYAWFAELRLLPALLILSLSYGLSAWISLQYIPRSPRPTSMIWRVGRDSRDSWISDISASVRQRLDIFVVASILGYSAAAPFGSALAAIAQLSAVSVTTFAVAMPLARISLDVQAILLRFLRITTTGTLLLAVITASLSNPLAWLITGDSDSPAGPIILGLLPAVLATAQSRIVTAGLQAVGDFRSIARISLTTMLLSLLLVSLGTLTIGLIGAAGGSSIAALVNLGLRYKALSLHIRVRARDTVLIRRDDVRWLISR